MSGVSHFIDHLSCLSKLCITGLCAGDPPVTGEIPAQWDSNRNIVRETKFLELLLKKKKCPLYVLYKIPLS